MPLTSIFPAACSGRWPHIHFEVYPSVDEAVAASSKIRTSQVALPEDACNLVYETDGYSQRVKNMKQLARHRQRLQRRVDARARNRHRRCHERHGGGAERPGVTSARLRSRRPAL